MQVHKAGFGRGLRRRQTSQGALFEMLRDLATGGEEGVKLRMLHVLMFEQIGRHMREIVEATCAQTLGVELIGGFGQFAAAVFEQGHGSPQGADELLEHLGHRLACPRLGHRHSYGMHVFEARGAGLPGVMMRVEGQHRQELAAAKRDGDIDDPDEAIGKGISTQRVFGQGAGLLQSRDREPGDPMDDSLRTRRFGQPQGGGQHAQDTTDGSEADARPHKEFQGNVD